MWEVVARYTSVALNSMNVHHLQRMSSQSSISSVSSVSVRIQKLALAQTLPQIKSPTEADLELDSYRSGEFLDTQGQPVFKKLGKTLEGMQQSKEKEKETDFSDLIIPKNTFSTSQGKMVEGKGFHRPKLKSFFSKEEIVPLIPPHYEKWTAWYSTYTVPELAAIVMHALQLLPSSIVDFEVFEPKSRILVIAYMVNEITVSKINFYRRPEDHNTLIEFKRQSGDHLPFTNFFQKLLESSQSLRATISSSAGDLTSGRPLMLDLELSFHKETVIALGEMVLSGDIRNLQDAARILANLSMSAKIRTEILNMKSEEFNIHDNIKILILAKDFQARRNGLIFLVNFSKIKIISSSCDQTSF